MTTKKTDTAAADPSTDALTATLVDNGTKDENGNTWRVEPAGDGTKGVRVHLLTKGGIALNVVAESEAKGREALLASPYAK
ncbi:hypothetical protein [Deinococcus navajonensis]|uniref:Uncharacterized protein n=1 Tax=Deinococcus navajonensis TaxID=309884 RepID=A0ABV8XUR6_9DEIO